MDSAPKIQTVPNISKRTPTLFGVDDGYAATKIWGPNGGHLKFPTMIKQGTPTLTDMQGRSVSAHYSTEGAHYTLGEKDSDDTVHDSFHGSNFNRVAVHHAVQELHRTGGKVSVACGLPFMDFFRGGSKNNDLVNYKKDSLTKPVQRMGGAHPIITIDSVSVFSQGVAGYMDRHFDQDGNIIDESKLEEPMVVMDIGGRTTDIVLLERGHIDQSVSETVNTGVLDVIKNLRGALNEKLGLSDASGIDLLTAQVILEKRSFKAHGRNIQVEADIDSAIRSVGDRLKNIIDKNIRSKFNIECIYLIGGGAYHFDYLFKQYGNLVVPEDPEFANARGFYKFLISLSAQENAS